MIRIRQSNSIRVGTGHKIGHRRIDPVGRAKKYRGWVAERIVRIPRKEFFSAQSAESLTGVIGERLYLFEEPTLLFHDLYGSRAFLVVIGNVVDAAAHGITLHLAGVVGLQQFADRIYIPHPWIEPKVVPVWIEDHWHAVVDG